MAKPKQQSPIEKKLSIPAAPVAIAAPVAAPAKPVEAPALKNEEAAAKPAKAPAVAAKAEAPKKAAAKKETKPAAKTTKAAPAAKAKAPKAPKEKQLTYEELVAKVSEKLKTRDASKIDSNIAAQITVIGEVEGIFYIEVKGGKIDVEPFDYKNNDFEITISSDLLLKVIEGKIGITAAVLSGKASFSGNAAKAFALGTLF